MQEVPCLGTLRRLEDDVLALELVQHRGLVAAGGLEVYVGE